MSDTRKQIKDQLCEQLDGMFQLAAIIETKSSSALFGDVAVTVHPTLVEVDQQDVYEAAECLIMAKCYIEAIETRTPRFQETRAADVKRIQNIINKLRGVK